MQGVASYVVASLFCFLSQYLPHLHPSPIFDLVFFFLKEIFKSSQANNGIIRNEENQLVKKNQT